MKFDKKYFDDIWSTGVHAHNYCPDLARFLIQKYGKVRFLDIGTGCGELVRVLRELGCQAYGLDISEYAVANSHGNVVLGSVTDIPFKDNSFDVVHSSGLWEYLTEEEIPIAVKECYRVGKHQEHNIDHDQTFRHPEYKFVTWKSLEWWKEKLKPPKILVACPVHECKEYSFQRWIDNVKKFTYPNIEIFCVDNSPNEEFMNRYKDQVPMVHIEVSQEPGENHTRITKSMAVIQRKFLAGNYERWFNLECDVIPPSNIIEFMLKYGRDTDWISHCYPIRDSFNVNYQQGIGCALLSRAIAESVDYELASSPDAWLWEEVRNAEKFTTMELWQYFPIKHLKE